MNGGSNYQKQWRWGKYLPRSRKRSGKVKFSPKAQAKWFLLLSDLLRVGFSLQRAVDFTTTTMVKEAGVLSKVRTNLLAGNTFANSVRPFIKVDLYYQLLLAEKHGDLVEVLAETGQLLVTRQRQVQKLKQLLQYPLILLCLLGVMMVGLATFVFPQLAAWQASNGCQSVHQFLPYLKWALVVLSLIFSAGGICKLITWRHLTKLQQVQHLCRLPLVGECYRLYYAYYITSALAVLLRAGMSLKEMMTTIEKFSDRTMLYQLGAEVQNNLAAGGQLENFIKRTIFLPDELMIFISKGATSKELGKDLTAFSRIQFKHLLARLEQLFSLVQPVIFIVIAAVIVGLYLSILLPIYQSLQGVY